MPVAVTLTKKGLEDVVPVDVDILCSSFLSTATDDATFSIPCNHIQGVVVIDRTGAVSRVCSISGNDVTVAGVVTGRTHDVIAFCD